jgi:cellulose synthase/poly-beta-1,6-N-acetylglucosamine synthase-like glycosyltransferase
LVLNHEVSAVTAACMLIRRDAFEEVSGFDDALAVGFGDVDLCLRVAERGYRVVFCPHAVLIHHESYTRGSTPHPEDTALYQFRWKALIAAGDPYYNPGMSLTRTDWAVTQPLHCEYELRRRIFMRGENGREAMSFSMASAPPAASA